MELGAPSQVRGASGAGGGLRGQDIAQQRVFAQIGGRVAFEDDGRFRIRIAALFGQRMDVVEQAVALILRQPDDLERAVAFHRAGRVVVNALAGPREQPRRGVIVVHDEIGVGLVALQRDADDHLPQRGARQRVGAAERLRAEKHVDAERAALAHDAVEEKRRSLGDGIVLDEKLLELVDDQQRAREFLGAARALVAGHVLDAQLAEEIAAPAQFLVHALEHAQGEFAVALDGDDARVRQPLLGVAFEFDALLEVDEVELDLAAGLHESARLVMMT